MQQLLRMVNMTFATLMPHQTRIVAQPNGSKFALVIKTEEFG